MDSLFPELERPRPPLADRVRPRRLDDIVGHAAVLGPTGWLRQLIARDRLPHVVLWGPPGVGKTTIAAALAHEVSAHFEARSAVQTGVAEVRAIMEQARATWRQHGRRTVFFLDEIHRFNKAQQDALLHDVERGTVTLVGATTENPAFSLNNALLSRVHVAVLEPLDDAAIAALLRRALTHRDGLGVAADDAAVAALVAVAGGDARFALSALEAAAGMADGDGRVTVALVERVLRDNPLRHDRAGDQHYDVVSAWIKTMRGSDVDAALYWAARLWEAGEDRRFLFRRLGIFASEDVGNADVRALLVATAAADAFERVGEAEGWIPFAQAVTFVAAAPKSNAAYAAYKAARVFVIKDGSRPVPAHLRNAPTALAKSLGHGHGYVYPHDRPDGVAPEVDYLPAGVDPPRFYEPRDRGDEAAIRARIEAYRQAHAAAQARRSVRDDERDA